MPSNSGLKITQKNLSKLKACTKDLGAFKNNVFNMLESNSLNIVQELSILEISFRIIAADEIEEEKEKAFVNDLRIHLELDDFLIEQRFGDISYLKPKKTEFKRNRSDDFDSITTTSK